MTPCCKGSPERRRGPKIGWTYWAWQYYDDPTGSSDGPLADPGGDLLPQAASLAIPYAEAVAGVPTVTDYDPSSRIFSLSYTVDPSVDVSTVVITVPARYPKGYCASVSGATIVSPPGVSHLLLQQPSRGQGRHLPTRSR